MPDDSRGSLEKLLDEGWDYHDKETERLASELEAAVRDGVPSALLPPFVHLSTHTIGEHLGDWPRALRLGKAVLDGRTPDSESARAWARLYVAAVLAGDALEAANLELSYLDTAGDDVRAALLELRFMLADALVGSNRSSDGAKVFRQALDVIRPEPSAALDRTVAVASNNLGWALYEMPSRDSGEDALMNLAAETSLKSWLRAGNWINAERAHYLAAQVCVATGDSRSALAHAEAALGIIADNGERPLDSALLHLSRAAALDALGEPAGCASAVADADAVAATLTANLRAQFDAERTKIAVPCVAEGEGS